MTVTVKSPHEVHLSRLPVLMLSGVGPRLQERFRKLGIETVLDLLFHLPRSYQDRTRIVPLRALQPGHTVAVEGNIVSAEIVFHGRRQLICYIEDGHGFLLLRFFNFSRAQLNGLKEGMRLRCFGEVRFGKKSLEMIHPEYRVVPKDNVLPVEETLTPIYPTTEGVSQFTWRKLQLQALKLLDSDRCSLELLPQKILEQLKFSNLKEALVYLHNPPADASLPLLESGMHVYQQRLIFEELLAHQLSLRLLREKSKKHGAVALPLKNNLVSKFLKQLPFDLTEAQGRVCREIQADLSCEHPMLRLVQGDVGSGKTVVAAIAALLAVENNCQAVVMAPTELLAEQHLQSFSRWLQPMGVNIAWLSGQLKGKARQETLEHIQNGDAQIIIGTHALFQDDVAFNELALVVIDEQHRFGVHQRLALREKGFKQGCYPHQLIMTATPIPRTLAMSAYADLDHSIIDELPPGRTPITTTVIGSHRRQVVIDRVRQACREKRQVYWVCPLVEESEFLQCQAAEKTTEQLMQAMPELNIALVHGRLKSHEKETIMQAFKSKEYDLLVATTVVEVGVDVPNASLMVIENAERFGLAQLHQLRGRVGRGNVESYCVLLYQHPLSQNARKRLAVMRESCDGFAIAQKDLEIRGPGEVLGTKQAGIVSFRVADILRDKQLLPKVQRVAIEILAVCPDIVLPLIHRWIFNAEEYGNA